MASAVNLPFLQLGLAPLACGLIFFLLELLTNRSSLKASWAIEGITAKEI